MVERDLHNQMRAGFLRRLLAALYDWLLILAVMMVLSVPVVALLDDAVAPGNQFYRIALGLLAAAFFTGFWSRGGQTLGMKAWRLRLRNADGNPVDFRRSSARLLYACISLLPAGLGFLWVIWDRDGKSWHDRWSGTELELLPKQRRKDA